MADQRLRFIAEWQDRGLKRGAQDAGKAIDGVDKSTKSLAVQFAAAAAVAGTVAVAIKKVYDVAKEGAQIELAAIKFDRLATSIGTTGDVLRNDLSIATQGLMSDAEQMALAGDLMSLGLAKTRDQAVRLTSVASQLGMNMNQLVLTLTNRTTMRFDALGVAVDGFDEKVKALEKSGLSVEDAFTEAFLQQAEQQIERVGSIAETSAGSILRFESSLKNLWDEMKLSTAQVVVPYVDSFGKLLNLMNTGEIGHFETMFRNMGAMVGIGRDKIDEMFDEVQRSKVAEADLRDFTDGLEDLAQAGREGVDPMQELAEATEDFSVSLDDANLSLDSFITKTQDQIAWIEAGGLALQDMAQAIKDDYEDGLIDATEANNRLKVVGIETIETLAEIENLSLEQIQNQFEDLGYDIDLARQLAIGVYNQIQALDGMEAYADIWITTHGRLPNLRDLANQAAQSGQPTSGSGSFAQQAGGDFIVPPWATGDSWPVRATAGERVQVGTASETQHEERMKLIYERRRDKNLAKMIGQEILIGMG